MSNTPPSTSENALAGEKFHESFAGEMNYGDYLQLDKILNAQKLWAGTHDEMLFIIIHQVNELWMKLMLHELQAAIKQVQTDELRPAFKMLARVSRIQEQLLAAWGVLATMTPSDYMAFRDKLGRSSGFQSYQYRCVEFVLGNKVKAMMRPQAHRPDLVAKLEALLNVPSIYDEAILLLARRGFKIDAAQTDRDWSQPRQPNKSVEDAWFEVYTHPQKYWDIYEFAEELVDIEDAFAQWRFRHANTVERIIGNKIGTGGTSGVGYLRRAVEIRVFHELWSVRTNL